MKHLIAILAVVALAATSAYAGCGKKTTVTGTLKYDSVTKAMTVEGTAKPIVLQASTKITDKDGKETKIENLDGQKVSVVHEHNKADSVAPAKEKA